MTLIRTWARRSLAVAAYYLGLDALFYHLNRRAKRIVTFHNVLPEAICKVVPHVGVSQGLDGFTRTVDELQKWFSFSTDIYDPGTVTITFDDGVLNEYEIAGRLLMKRDIPAILFVAGDVIGKGEMGMLVTDQLLVWTNFAPAEVARREFGSFSSRRELWIRYVSPAYRADGETRGRRLLARLNAAYPLGRILEELPLEWRRLRMTGVSRAHLDELRAKGWLIGWHTWSHYPLGALDDCARRAELEAPEEYRSVVLGYPYGDVESVGMSSLQIAEEMGFPSAVSNTLGRSSGHGRYFLPRMALSENKYELHMVLSGLKHFLKNHELLPVAEMGCGVRR